MEYFEEPTQAQKTGFTSILLEGFLSWAEEDAMEKSVFGRSSTVTKNSSMKAVTGVLPYSQEKRGYVINVVLVLRRSR